MLSGSELVQHNRVAGGLVRPSADQGLQAIPRWIEDGLLHQQGPFRAPNGRLIVLALDAIRHDIATELWSPPDALVVTSTFPSTSVVAWLTALTGRTASELGIPGVVYLDERADGLFHVFRDIVLPRGKWSWVDDARSARDLPFGPWQSVFSRLGPERAIACAGDLVAWPGRWADALLRGASVVVPRVDWSRIRHDAQRIVDWAVDEVDGQLAATSRQELALIWVFVNFDDYVHASGYGDALKSALAGLERHIERWVGAGNVVVAHSDHGMVPCHVDRCTWEGWEALNGPEWCERPAGGAGRVRWCHPRPERRRDLALRLTDLLGDRGLVVDRSELGRMGLMQTDSVAGERLGEIVALAIGDDFPVPDPAYCWEHGSATAAEMLCPIGVWR